MRIWNSLAIGIREIWSHKFRSFLTMLGIILGVAALLATFALVAGMAAGSRETMRQYGGVEKVDVITQEPPAEQQAYAEISPGRTLWDAQAIRDSVAGVANVTPIYEINPGRVNRGSETTTAEVFGVWPEYSPINNHVVEFGRNLSQIDLDEANHVCVIGRNVVDGLWPGRPEYNRVGETVLIGGKPFVVVGVFEFYEREEDKRRRKFGIKPVPFMGSRSGSRRMFDPFFRKNRSVIIPFTTAFHDFKSYKITGANNEVDLGAIHTVDGITIQVADAGALQQTLDEVSEVLRQTHRGIEDFSFNTRLEFLDRIEEQTRNLRLVGGLIAGLSLVVGGIGIMNIMLASITERVREIGVRRAVGAKSRHIFAQILVESAVIGVIGGALGLLASQGLIEIFKSISPAEYDPIVDMKSAALSFAAAVLIGIGSGIYPAWKASRIAPIEALRYG